MKPIIQISNCFGCAISP